MIKSQKTDWKVCVRCYTFNHAPYIKETMDGFCLQETNFPFICAIVDDASTDGEPEVIKEYLNEHFKINDKNFVRIEETEDFYLAFAQHKTNLNCFFAVYLLKYNHFNSKAKRPYLNEWLENSEYEAICEGDDYWIHPKKLQMQVDFLDLNPDYSLVHTDFDLVEGNRRHYREINSDGCYYPGILNNSANIGTLTVLYRLSTFNSLAHLYRKNAWPMSDLPLWIEFSHAAKIKYIDVITSKYRVLHSSASHSQNINKLIAFRNSGIEIKRFYAQFFKTKLVNDGYSKNYYIDMMRLAYRLNDHSASTFYLKEAIKKRLLTVRAFIYYLGVIFPLLRKFIGIH